MNPSLFFGGSIIAAVVAGGISLLAPCCISVMLPAYFASAFQNRKLLVAMTLVFALGIATTILPIVLGVSLVRQLILNNHALVYILGGVFMLALGLYVLLGGKLQIPGPRGGPKSAKGPFGVYLLGIFSGVASSCCAPVLAGVIALSSISGSTLGALGLGVAYVFGMVAPLFILSLLGERFDMSHSRLFKSRSVVWKIGSLQRKVNGSALASGILLIIMGIFSLWMAASGNGMLPASGWQTNIALTLQHVGKQLTGALSWIPSLAAGVIIITALLFLIYKAIWQITEPLTAENFTDEHKKGEDE